MADLVHCLEEHRGALETVKEAFVGGGSAGGAGGGGAVEEAVDALMDMQRKIEDLHRQMVRKVLPDDGFAEHISHRLAAEKTRSKVWRPEPNTKR